MEVVNVVGMITYEQELDLHALADTFSNRDEIASVKFDPANNHWLEARFEPDEAYVGIYRSGRCTVAGADSVEHFRDVENRVTAVMRDLLHFEYEPETDIKNIVATAEIGLPVSLDVLAVHLGMENVEYEPEQFPALMYRGLDHTILLFSSGKMVCTGLSNIELIPDKINEIELKIEKIEQS